MLVFKFERNISICIYVYIYVHAYVYTNIPPTLLVAGEKSFRGNINITLLCKIMHTCAYFQL